MNKTALKILINLNFIAVLIVTVYHYSYFNSADTDLWGRLFSGSIYLTKGWVYHNDIFSFVPTLQPWVDHEWISGILFFLSVKFLGEPGILLIKLILIILTMYLIFLGAYLRENTPKSILFYILILFGLFPSFGSNVRPHCFTFMFFTLWLFLLEYSRMKNCNKYLFVMPVTMLLWVNMHAGCISGLALIAVYILSNLIEKKPIKPYLLILLFSIGVMFCNPYFLNYFIYIKDELLSSHSYILEWMSVNLMDINNYIWYKILLVLTIVGVIFSRRKKTDPVALILLISLAIIGFKVGRHNTMFVIVCGVFVYEHLYDIYQNIVDKITSSYGDKVKLRAQFIFENVIPLFVILVYLPFVLKTDLLNWKLALKPDEYPVKVVIFIKENNLKGNILLPFKWGNYVTWKTYPEIKVSCDGRFITVYPPESFKLSNDFYYVNKGWNEIFKKYSIQYLLIDKKSPIFKKRKMLKNWHIINEDEVSVLMISNNNKLAKPYIIPNDKDLQDDDNLKSFFLKK